MSRGYFAFEGLEKELIHDLKGDYHQHGRLFIEKSENQKLIETPWAQTILDPVLTQSIESITKTAAFLKSVEGARRWFPYAYHLHRRTELIAEQIRNTSIPLIDYRGRLPHGPWGHWCLKSENEVLYSVNGSHPLPWGEVLFNEDKNAPSRAYMKLWEIFTLHMDAPPPKAVTVDMGSSPGGWTYVLEKLGCKVYSMDRSPLRDDLMKSPLIEHAKKDVFKLEPKDLPDLEWFFSDVICYPDKLYPWICKWLEHPRCKNFVVTIKFQGTTDFDTLAKFQALPDSRVIHLYNNKHELTWICQRN
ncbi:MAG: SAM-dependent methyltransferase [Bdellovibrionota bacterium]